MKTIAQIELAWHLWQENIPVDQIARRTNRHRATIYRWIKKFKQIGIQRTIRWYSVCKKGRRQKRITVETKIRIIEIRNKYHRCCGLKIRYFLYKEYDMKVSVSTIYRVLRSRYKLSSKFKRRKYGEAPKGKAARDVMQADTVDFGEVIAYTYIDTFTREAYVDLELGFEAADGYASLTNAQKIFKRVNLLQTDGGGEFEGEFSKRVQDFADKHRVSRPYKKNEQSFIESFNRTLRKECLGWRKYQMRELPAMKERVEKFLVYYNKERPHLGLGMKTPSEEASLSHLR